MPESYKEDRRPAQQWYWNDWFSAFDVRNCSLAARGLWIDMLGIMWKAEIRGTLTVNGKQPDNKTLANIVGSSASEIKPLLKELETNNVFSRLDDGTIICRRMFRESAKKGDISKIRSKAGKEGAKKRWQTDGKPMAKHGKNNLPLTKGNGKPMAKTTEVGDSKASKEKMAKMAASTSSSSSTSTSTSNQRVGSGTKKTPDPPHLRIKFNFKKKEWQGIIDEDTERWKKSFPDVDIGYHVFTRMVDWIISNPRKGRKKNYARFINNWLSDEQEKFDLKNARKHEDDERAKEWLKEKD